ncbi:MAG TPA: CCA tRNA nucleotidyltransferase [candidate division Zixibacteria bacterium]|nr:CCA tRNA nucleotidyltransferase [candidate division Zixibacteria bacterium]
MRLRIPENEVSRVQFILALDIAEKLQRAGFESLVVGGAVRDALLEIPSPDVDLCTACPSEELEKLIPNARPWGFCKYSVYRVPSEHGTIEIARFREEASCDGRHCEVRLTDSFERDVRRRDFTINALAVRPITLEVVDLVGGVADLSARTIRAIGEPIRRYEEDKLRILRAVRFATRLDFKLSSDDAVAIEKLANGVKTLSAERVRGEIGGILECSHSGNGLELLIKLGIWCAIFGEEFDGDDIELARRVALLNSAAVHGISRAGMWAIFLAPIELKNKDLRIEVDKKLERLKFPKAEREKISRILDGIRLALDFDNLTKALSTALADSPELSTVRKLTALVAPDVRLETRLARRFPNLGAPRFLRGSALGEIVKDIPAEKVATILSELRYAELSGEVHTLDDAEHFITSRSL